MIKKFFITANGCPENRIDCARIELFLSNNGWTITHEVAESDLVIFNACGLTQKSEDSSLSIIKTLMQLKKVDSLIIVSGCLPRINKKCIEECFQGSIFDTNDLDLLAETLHIENTSKYNGANYLISNSYTNLQIRNNPIVWLKKQDLYSLLYLLYRRKYLKLWESTNIIQLNTYYIKISSGCTNSCSYCAVKLSRGDVISKSIVQIKNELIAGLKSGFKEVAIIGTDIGSYGKDMHTDLGVLLESLISIDGDFHLKLRNVNPQYYIHNLSRFLTILNSGKVSHMTSAVQSGSNRILHAMNRGYKIENVIYAINSIKSAFPNITIRTQLMVGFPGETNIDFQNTLQLLDKVQFDFVEVYKYSARTGTSAFDMANQVATKLINKRAYLLTRAVIRKLNV